MSIIFLFIRILSLFAYHIETKKVLPKDFLLNRIKSRNCLSALEYENNIVDSIFDIEIFSYTKDDIDFDLIKKNVMKEYSSFEYSGEKNLNFSLHLTNYSSGLIIYKIRIL
jgi:Zn-dependent oligopeptidase